MQGRTFKTGPHAQGKPKPYVQCRAILAQAIYVQAIHCSSVRLAASGFHGVGEDSSGKTSTVTVSPMAVSEVSGHEESKIWLQRKAVWGKGSPGGGRAVLERGVVERSG